MSPTKVHVSDDGGETWYKHHAFDGLSADALGIVGGGTDSSIHVAVLRGPSRLTELETHIGTLVIRSFTPGTWQKSKIAAPDWFKENVMPAPTKENF
jgi:hypothetical protein